MFHATLLFDGCLSWASGAIAEQATRHRGFSRPTSTRDPDIGDTIMRMYLDMAEAGIKWHPVDGTDDEALRNELVLVPFMQYVDSVRSRISVWRRWVRWHDVHASADSVYSPTALRMGAFLWWRVTLGVPLPVDDELLRQLKVSHTPQSAPVLHLRALQSLLRLAADPA